eukprot:s397_g14.t3
MGFASLTKALVQLGEAVLGTPKDAIGGPGPSTLTALPTMEAGKGRQRGWSEKAKPGMARRARSKSAKPPLRCLQLLLRGHPVVPRVAAVGLPGARQHTLHHVASCIPGSMKVFQFHPLGRAEMLPAEIPAVYVAR